MSLMTDYMGDGTAKDIPEEFDGTLDCSSLSVSCAFNRRGSLLAVGCNDGRVVIWDFLTQKIARSIVAHAAHPACSISWSRNGRKIVTASIDNTIAIWDVVTGKCILRWRYTTPILKASFNPRDDRMVLICPHRSQAVLLCIKYDNGKSEPASEQKPDVHYIVLPGDKDDADSPNNVASFDRRGEYMYSGNARGKLVIVKCPDLNDNCEPTRQELEIISSFKIQSTSFAAAIREIEFGARNKKTFLVNSSDRTIRLYDCKAALAAGINGHCEEVRKFQDLVNKTMWRRCCFSGDKDGSYVCGGSARQHALYIWDSSDGIIKKMLQGTKGELLLDVQWHPQKPILVSVSSGLVSIWARPQIENWSAFAPDFKELDENLEYDEKETEFDIEDEDVEKQKREKRELEEEVGNLDISGHLSETDLISSDEETLDPNYLEILTVRAEDQLDIDLN